MLFRSPEHMAVAYDFKMHEWGEAGTEGFQLHGNPLYLGRSLFFFYAELISTQVGTAWAALDEYRDLLRRGTSFPPRMPRTEAPEYQRWYGKIMSLTEAASRREVEPERFSFNFCLPRDPKPPHLVDDHRNSHHGWVSSATLVQGGGRHQSAHEHCQYLLGIVLRCGHIYSCQGQQADRELLVTSSEGHGVRLDDLGRVDRLYTMQYPSTGKTPLPVSKNKISPYKMFNFTCTVLGQN